MAFVFTVWTLHICIEHGFLELGTWNLVIMKDSMIDRQRVFEAGALPRPRIDSSLADFKLQWTTDMLHVEWKMIMKFL